MLPDQSTYQKLATATKLLAFSTGLVILVEIALLFWAISPQSLTATQTRSVPGDAVPEGNPASQTIAQETVSGPGNGLWQAPDTASIPFTAEGAQIRYGRELIAHTARYLGPKGSVMTISNGMNCQNCHLEAGTKTFGNNYSAVASTYPKFRARSGSRESIEKRVNDCFERSLNGKPLDSASREMRAMVAYIQWLGKDVAKGEKVKGVGLVALALLNRAADPAKGQLLYTAKCQACHGAEGEGIRQADGVEYQFPPLWGKSSYNVGAGLYRLSNFARYIRANMPLGASFDYALLSEEEAWDIAAYVNSMPRPEKDLRKDWPRLDAKPFDHPFGPYADTFSEKQHKYGPFQPIIEAAKP